MKSTNQLILRGKLPTFYFMLILFMTISSCEEKPETQRRKVLLLMNYSYLLAFFKSFIIKHQQKFNGVLMKE